MKQTCNQPGLRSCNAIGCSASFEITDADLNVYASISPLFEGEKYIIPSPTLCPQCRNQRRMAWRNDRTFYHRTCSKTGEKIISIYPENTPFPVYKNNEWWTDDWDPMNFGQDIDFNKSFFEQWQELMHKVPRRNVDLVNCENSNYCNYSGDEKNCYVDIAAEGNEDCYFNLFVKYSKNCTDCTFVYRCTLCYECIHCYGSYNCKESMYLDNCSDCNFCFDLKGCKNCLFSTNVRNKEYYILNEPHTKEEYQRKIKELNIQSHKATTQLKQLWEKIRIEKGIYRDMYNMNCEQCTGNDIHNSKNCTACFNIVDCEDCAYLYDVLEAKDCRDLNYSLYKPQNAYELISTLNLQYSAFNLATHFSNNVFYCDHTDYSHDLFGCIGLQHKEYCILNKQYSKEEYRKLVPRIIEHMKKYQEWGEFFPITMSPHGYNETVAQEYMPLSQEQIKMKGWKWTEREENTLFNSNKSDTIIPDHIDQADESICDQILICELTGKRFKIIPQELAFYKKQGICIPHLCPDARHLQRMHKRNPRTLHTKQCSECKKKIQTTYGPNRHEKIYCEECYLAKVY